MRRLILAVSVLSWTAVPSILAAQYGGFGGRGEMGEGGFRRPEVSAPKLPGPELDGPPDSTAMQALVSLTDSQAARYAQAYDAFMVATRPQRDSAQVAKGKMNQRLNSGDRAAALFYAERLQDLGKVLRDRQDKFEHNLRTLLTKDQQKTYKDWKDEQQRQFDARAREEALRWEVRPDFSGGFANRRPERKTVPATPGLAVPALGAQVVQVGRTLYITAQLPVDSAGNLVGGDDLAAQAKQAFANLGAVLQAANSQSDNVLQLTVYVVNYQPAALDTIRSAASVLFPTANQPTVTVLGVQSLATPGARIAVQATALTAAAEASAER
jgi:enamine deaminase RidA (YjgF/YER057c/UK114 family)/Spy/CpxP family protein refolding chaperone